MTIKSLLLGSAAGLVAVSGAQAADAIVYAEPEPVEYVRVCDVYGAGFFYIPGTETCLKVGGYAQYDIGIGRHGINGTTLTPIFDEDDEFIGVEAEDFETYYKRARFNLVLDARSDTELGTLRGYFSGFFDHITGLNSTAIIESDFEGTSSVIGSTTGYNVEHAYIELGGLRLGVTDSLFSTFNGYTLSGTINGSSVLRYGPFTTHQVAYTFAGANGFSAAVALETGSGFGGATGAQISDYTPHVVAGLGFTQGWGGLRVVGAYDSVRESFAAKARADFNVGAGSVFVQGGWADGLNTYAPWSVGSDWMVQGGGRFTVSEVASVGAAVSYEENGRWGALANVIYQPVAGLAITPEVTYTDDGADNAWGGSLRFRRSF